MPVSIAKERADDETRNGNRTPYSRPYQTQIETLNSGKINRRESKRNRRKHQDTKQSSNIKRTTRSRRYLIRSQGELRARHHQGASGQDPERRRASRPCTDNNDTCSSLEEHREEGVSFKALVGGMNEGEQRLDEEEKGNYGERSTEGDAAAPQPRNRKREPTQTRRVFLPFMFLSLSLSCISMAVWEDERNQNNTTTGRSTQKYLRLPSDALLLIIILESLGERTVYENSLPIRPSLFGFQNLLF